MVETEKVYQLDEKKFLQVQNICENAKNRIEEIIESREAYNNTLYILNKELENETLKTRLRSTNSTNFSSPRKHSPSNLISN